MIHKFVMVLVALGAGGCIEAASDDEGGDLLAEVKVAASFKLNRSSAERWAANNFAKPK